MIEQAFYPINNIYGNVQLKYENIDFLDFIESTMEKCPQRSEFRIDFPNLRLSCMENIEYYIKNKLLNMKLQNVNFKSHFKKPCFNCSSSFHCSSFEDDHFNLQKMCEVGEKCITCEKNYTTERLFYHNCNICYASLNNCKLLVRHHKREHNSKNPIQCAACHLSLSSQAFHHHIYKHKRPYICSYCNKRYAKKCYLKLHILSHTGQKPYPCNFCPKKYLSKVGLEIHLYEHIGGKSFKCDMCDKTFATVFLLNQHKKSHIKKPIHMEKLFQCKYCPKQFRVKHSLDAHLFEHTGGKTFKCDFCYKTYAKRYILNRHKRIHLENVYQCRFCPKQYKTKTNLNRHEIEHTDGKLFDCDLCDKAYAALFLLNQHKRRVHLKNPEMSFQCIYCPKEYKVKHSLDAHLFEHVGGKNFKCDSCDKSFAKRYRLNKHKAIHTGKVFQCNYCTKQYKTKSYLEIHLYEHNVNVKQFKCDLCEKTFARQFQLNEHNLTHMERSFQCTICSKLYKTPAVLRRHLRRIHKHKL